MYLYIYIHIFIYIDIYIYVCIYMRSVCNTAEAEALVRLRDEHGVDVTSHLQVIYVWYIVVCMYIYICIYIYRQTMAYILYVH